MSTRIDPVALRDAVEAHRDALLAVKTARSPKWREVREAFLKEHPTCAACGQVDPHHVNVHHRLPFHLFPEKELDPANLIPLCEMGPAGANCHLLYGHGGVWTSYNPTVEQDAARMLAMLAGIVRG